ncbi:hypothetical protein BDB00DRAFT_302801 [Zychaea mexicana]|uniref:uncharacterized protein n=1 Tax=Zychaea mexicana TaxID=64656 RepID=UPI0022FDE2F4|nr:uncharacterized protein BDB00DRAFT_302801 [Zychaea mexicana]KAI9467610.1 hypothetical protein BDB00DRAFT_302801 [Zychaea mexicana]
MEALLVNSYGCTCAQPLVSGTSPKLSCRATFHRICLGQLSLCVHGIDDLLHFLADCPKKRRIWRSVWRVLLLLFVADAQIHAAILHLPFPPDPPSTRSHIVFEAIRHGLWRVHWVLVFDNRPFIINSLIQAIHKTITRRIAEQNLPMLCV